MRVLIIDDNQDVSYLVSMLVKHCGHDTRVVSVAEDALGVAREWKPEFVFLDLAMPGMDGYAVARLLRQHGHLNGAKIVALSGYPHDGEKEQMAGIDGHVLKPITLTQLRCLLSNLP
jgi:CheY-like chemotaxis protein